MKLGIVIKNGDEVRRRLEQRLRKVEDSVTDVFRGYCVDAFRVLLETTPQWSGSAVASWNFSVNFPNYEPDTSMAAEYESEEARAKPLPLGPLYDMGDSPAIKRALARNVGQDLSVVSLYSEVFFTNTSRGLSSEAYVEKLETNPNGYLRFENDGGGMVAKMKNYLHGRYSPIDERDKLRLKTLRLDGGLA